MNQHGICLINEKGIVQLSVDDLKEFTRQVKVDAINEYIDANNTLILPVEFSKKYAVSVATVMQYAKSYPKELIHSHPTPRKYFLYEQKMCAKMQEIGRGSLKSIIHKKE